MSVTIDLRHVRTARPRLTVRGLADSCRTRRPPSRARSAAQLDDHMLRDIGVTRADIEDELRRPLV